LKYFNVLDNKYHTYYPDFIVHLSNGNTIIVEVKPKAQLRKPSPPTRQTTKSVKNYKWLYEMWVTNMCKKQAAEEVAKAKGWQYMLVTEDFFKITPIS
jgi:hypothetical protein